MNTLNIKYNASVLTPAGFRSVTMTAVAEKISEKRCKIIEVTHINGDEVQANMSRTGANRQKFYGIGTASREVDKIKNLSACELIA